MADPVITNNDSRPNAQAGPVDQREEIFTSAGATHAAGMLIGRLTATNKLVPYNDAGVAGEEVAMGVLNVERILTAGDHLIEYIVHGPVRESKLNAQNGDPITPLETDLLQQVGIIAKPETELAEVDNPQP